MLNAGNGHMANPGRKVRFVRQWRGVYSNPILFDSTYPLWYYPAVLANIM
jgi:hypothetical protein